MPFPDSRRVIYKRNPLAEVICQVRFPPILRIEADAPVAYQERVRADYPLFREVQTDVPVGDAPPEIAKILKKILPHMPGRVPAYEFTSADGAWTISLSRDALAVRTTAYERWEGFREHLEQSLDSLNRTYSPAFFLRVGLRYIDVIDRRALGMEDRPWSELLQPHIAGEFLASEIAEHIEHIVRELRIKLVGEGSVMIRHGIATRKKTDGRCFFIDSDFFEQGRLEPNHVLELLGQFNQKSGRLFRWCIRDALHNAMEPTVVSE